MDAAEILLLGAAFANQQALLNDDKPDDDPKRPEKTGAPKKGKPSCSVAFDANLASMPIGPDPRANIAPRVMYR